MKIKRQNTINWGGIGLLITIGLLMCATQVHANEEIEYMWFNLHDELKMLQELYRAKANEKKINLLFNDETNVLQNININSDITKVKQIISNLLNNAIKFTPEDGYVELRTSIYSKSDTHVRVLFSVSDTGIGIDQNRQEDIFKAFIQENQSVTRNYGGTGLGLAICKELVELLGGQLQLESKQNYGSNFYFILDFEYTIDVEFNKKREEKYYITDGYKGNI